MAILKENTEEVKAYFELRDKLWKQVKINNGQYQYEYEYILPENINENTPIVFLYQGHQSEQEAYAEYAEGLEQSIDQYGSDAIYVHVDTAKYDNEQVSATQIIEDIQKNTGVELSNYSGNVMHSAGFVNSLSGFANYITENPDLEPQLLISLEGYKQGGEHIQQFDAATTIGRGNHILLAFHQAGWGYDPDYEKMVRECGLNVIKLEQGSGHTNYTKRYVEDALNKFHLGEGPFPPGYKAKMYVEDADGEWKWKEIDLTGMTKREVYKLCNVNSLSLDLNYLSNLSSILSPGIYTLSDTLKLNTYLDNVINAIRNGATGINSNKNVTFQSTTSAPTELSNIIKLFMLTGTNLFDKISKDMYEFAKIGKSKEEVDKDLTNELEHINRQL